MAAPSRSLFSASSLLLLVALVACDPQTPAAEPEPGTSGPAPPHSEEPEQPTDSDGDGLPDTVEEELGTSILSPDTDGDGYTDYQEVVDLNFDPSQNPYRFNPRVADVPVLDVEVVGAPHVYITHTVSESESKTYDNTRSAETSSSVSSSRTTGMSSRVEFSATVGYETSASVSLTDLGVSASQSSSFTSTFAAEASMNWTEGQSQENRNTLSESRGYQTNHDVAKSAGEVEVKVNLRNAGHIAFTIQNLALGVEKLDLNGAGLIDVGQLELETSRPFFELGTLQPGEVVKGLVFQKRELNLDKTERLLDPGGFIVRTALYELLDINKQAFDHRYTEIMARTATVVIDYGPEAASETYLVATEPPHGVALTDVLDEILRIPYQAGTTLWNYPEGVGKTKQGFLQIRDRATDSAGGSYWVVAVSQSDGREVVTRRHHPLQEELDPAQLFVKPGQSIQLVYITDADRDGLGSRTEFLIGTDPKKADTDRDGVSDGDEVRDGRNPLRDDSDRPPFARVIQLEQAGTSVVLEVETQDPEGEPVHSLRINWGDNSETEVVEAPGTEPLRLDHRYPQYGSYAITLTPYASPDAPGPPLEVEAELRPLLVPSWWRQLGSPKVEWFMDMATDAEGNVYFTGHHMEVGTLTGNGFGRVYLVKHSPSGERQWVVQFGREPEVEEAGALGIGPDGGILLACEGRDNQGVFMTVRRFSREGDEEWVSKVRGAYFVQDLAVAPDGSIYVVGRSWRTMPNSNRPGEKSMDYGFLVRLDPKGQVLWSRQLKPNLGKRVVVARDGGVITVWDGPVPGADDRGQQMILRRFSPEGEQLWERHYGSRGRDNSSALALDEAGNIYLAGAVMDRLIDKPNRGFGDACLLKLSPDGEPIWMRQFGTTGPDGAIGVAIDSRGTIHLVGGTSGRLDDETAELAVWAFAVFVASFDQEGQRIFLFQQNIGTEVIDNPLKPSTPLLNVSRAVVDGQGNLYVGGMAAASIDEEAYTPQGETDLFLLKFVPDPRHPANADGE